MLKITNKTGVDETVEIIKIHKNRFDIEIDSGNNKSRFITLMFEYSENENSEKTINFFGVGKGEFQWVRDPLGSNSYEEIFDLLSDFIDNFFNSFSENDRNNIQGEIMAEIENYCKNHKINGIE